MTQALRRLSFRSDAETRAETRLDLARKRSAIWHAVAADWLEVRWTSRRNNRSDRSLEERTESESKGGPMATVKTTGFDVETLRRGVERRDADALNSLYANDAECIVIDRTNPPGRPRELRGKEAIAESTAALQAGT
jgi:hypothetical protein